MITSERHKQSDPMGVTGLFSSEFEQKLFILQFTVLVTLREKKI